MPRWVWAVVGGGALLALGCLALAVMLSRSESWQQRFERRGKIVEREALLPVERAVGVPIYAGPTEMVVGEPVGVDSATVVVSVSEVVTATAPMARWQRHAGVWEVPVGVPQLAIVIDDMGVDRALSERALAELPPAVTLAFLPYGAATRELALQARTKGHEILVHIPMEPLVHMVSDTEVLPEMGPGGLKVGMAADEIGRRVRQNVAGLLDVAVGANNHMGSKFTRWPEGMRAVLEVMQEEGLLFLDSRTAARTAVREAAVGLEVPLLGRDVFLDHEEGAAAVRAELQKAVALAKKRGFAVAIGHPLPATLDVLRAELGGLSGSVVLVGVTGGIKNKYTILDKE
ncbi:MAG: divergent polysaccharide deacetylase family protein [Proteobacteria bacterium]|nr:divergent polysaccharide deacetylase family protein [Pseudomonadota bacterium]